jgi:hypothetical protein
MPNVAAKVASTGNDRILLTERGVSFGYNTLVTDMRSLPEMMKTGYPVVMDATHSVQQPGGQGGSSGGQREFAPVMARAAVSLGIAAVFIETHEAPDTAPSDGPNMIPLDAMPALVDTLMAFDHLAKETRSGSDRLGPARPFRLRQSRLGSEDVQTQPRVHAMRLLLVPSSARRHRLRRAGPVQTGQPAGTIAVDSDANQDAAIAVRIREIIGQLDGYERRFRSSSRTGSSPWTAPSSTPPRSRP